jgi:hypothetical protein
LANETAGNFAALVLFTRVVDCGCITFIYTADSTHNMPANLSSIPALKTHVEQHAFLTTIESGVEKITVFCSYCSKSFSCSKTNHVKDHLKAVSHLRACELRNKRQSTRIEDSFTMELAMNWISAGLCQYRRLDIRA